MDDWHPLDTAPLDCPVDHHLERWVGEDDRLTTNIARGASWITRTSVSHPHPHWSRVPTGWRVTAWRPNTDPTARPVTRNRRGGPASPQPESLGDRAMIRAASKGKSAVSNGTRRYLKPVDGRTEQARRFAAILGDVEAEHGGAANMSIVTKAAARAFTQMSVEREIMEMRGAEGQDIDTETYGQLCDGIDRRGRRPNPEKRAATVKLHLRSCLRRSGADFKSANGMDQPHYRFQFKGMKRFMILCLLMPFPLQAAWIDTEMVLGCRELSTQQSLRLRTRLGEGDAYEQELRKAIKSKSCRPMPDQARVDIKERSGPFVCVKAADTDGRCEWVEAVGVAQ